MTMAVSLPVMYTLLLTLFLTLAMHHQCTMGHPLQNGSTVLESQASSNCFPAIGFSMPSSVPSTTSNWWCDPSTEYAFLGFSYEVTACKSTCPLYAWFSESHLGQSVTELIDDFKNIRQTFHGRYIRLYGACDRQGF